MFGIGYSMGMGANALTTSLGLVGVGAYIGGLQRVSYEYRNLQRSMDAAARASTAFERGAHNMSALGSATIGVGMAVTGLSMGMRALSHQVSEVYRRAEDARAKLAEMARVRGQSPGQLTSFNKWADQFALKVGQSTPAIQEASSRLLGYHFNLRQIQSIMPGIIGQSRTYGISMEQVANQIGRGISSGNLAQMRRAGITLSSNELKGFQEFKKHASDAQIRTEGFRIVLGSLRQYAVDASRGLSSLSMASMQYNERLRRLHATMGEGAAESQMATMRVMSGVLDKLSNNPGLTKQIGVIMGYGGAIGTIAGPAFMAAGGLMKMGAAMALMQNAGGFLGALSSTFLYATLGVLAFAAAWKGFHMLGQSMGIFDKQESAARGFLNVLGEIKDRIQWILSRGKEGFNKETGLSNTSDANQRGKIKSFEESEIKKSFDRNSALKDRGMGVEQANQNLRNRSMAVEDEVAKRYRAMGAIKDAEAAEDRKKKIAAGAFYLMGAAADGSPTDYGIGSYGITSRSNAGAGSGDENDLASPHKSGTAMTAQQFGAAYDASLQRIYDAKHHINSTSGVSSADRQFDVATSIASSLVAPMNSLKGALDSNTAATAGNTTASDPGALLSVVQRSATVSNSSGTTSPSSGTENTAYGIMGLGALGVIGLGGRALRGRFGRGGGTPTVGTPGRGRAGRQAYRVGLQDAHDAALQKYEAARNAEDAAQAKFDNAVRGVGDARDQGLAAFQRAADRRASRLDRVASRYHSAANAQRVIENRFDLNNPNSLADEAYDRVNDEHIPKDKAINLIDKARKARIKANKAYEEALEKWHEAEFDAEERFKEAQAKRVISATEKAAAARDAHLEAVERARAAGSQLDEARTALDSFRNRPTFRTRLAGIGSRIRGMGRGIGESVRGGWANAVDRFNTGFAGGTGASSDIHFLPMSDRNYDPNGPSIQGALARERDALTLEGGWRGNLRRFDRWTDDMLGWGRSPAAADAYRYNVPMRGGTGFINRFRGGVDRVVRGASNDFWDFANRPFADFNASPGNMINRVRNGYLGSPTTDGLARGGGIRGAARGLLGAAPEEFAAAEGALAKIGVVARVASKPLAIVGSVITGLTAAKKDYDQSSGGFGAGVGAVGTGVATGITVAGGAAAGAIVGQALIPIPVVGALIGGAVGAIGAEIATHHVIESGRRHASNFLTRDADTEATAGQSLGVKGESHQSRITRLQNQINTLKGQDEGTGFVANLRRGIRMGINVGGVDFNEEQLARQRQIIGLTRIQDYERKKQAEDDRQRSIAANAAATKAGFDSTVANQFFATADTVNLTNMDTVVTNKGDILRSMARIRDGLDKVHGNVQEALNSQYTALYDEAKRPFKAGALAAVYDPAAARAGAALSTANPYKKGSEAFKLYNQAENDDARLNMKNNKFMRQHGIDLAHYNTRFTSNAAPEIPYGRAATPEAAAAVSANAAVYGDGGGGKTPTQQAKFTPGHRGGGKVEFHIPPGPADNAVFAWNQDAAAPTRGGAVRVRKGR